MRCLRESLQQSPAQTSLVANDTVNETNATYASLPAQGLYESGIPQHDRTLRTSFFGTIQTVLLNRFLLTQTQESLYLIDVQRAQANLNCRFWQQAYEAGEIKNRPVLFPQRLALSTQQQNRYEQLQDLLASLGFGLTPSGPQQLLLRAVPIWLQGFDSPLLLLSVLDSEVDKDSVFAKIERCLVSQQFDITNIDFKHFLNTFSQERDRLAGCWREMTQADLTGWLRESQIQHE